ncbi:MAG TPA: response regulator, partial [Helicobacteraceae bacterium]|nr:response regulator [Helicobacteraceae bacterium]
MTSQKLSKNSKSSILIVDDAPENLRYLNELLSAQGYDIRATLDGQTALEVAQVISPDLILLDIQMPSMDGYRVSEALQKIPALKETPIIFISALDDVEDKIKAFRAGGVDYISKPFEAQEVIARVGAHIQLHQSKQEVQKLLEQQDYFIKKIMHEMNTPVSVIKLCAQALEVQAGSNSQISTINASAKILASIYDDLGYLIRKEHHEYPR